MISRGGLDQESTTILSSTLSFGKKSRFDVQGEIRPCDWLMKARVSA